MNRPLYIDLIEPENLANFWGAMADHLRRGCDRDFEGELTLDSLYRDCKSGHSWAVVFRDENLVIQGAAILTAKEKRRGKFLYITVLAGDFDCKEWAQHVCEFAEQVALMTDCTAGIAFNGRMGWIRKLREYGYEPVFVTMLRKL